MKIELVCIQTSKDPWLQSFIEEYERKISAMIPFNVEVIKSNHSDRKNKTNKIEFESQKLLKILNEPCGHILFDESGKKYSSEAFSADLIKKLEQHGGKLRFIIGGAFGVSEEVKSKCSHKVSLSPFVLNHKVAMVVSLEQIYRALTIWKNIPYHNS